MKPTYQKSVCMVCLPDPCTCNYKDNHPGLGLVDLKTAVRHRVSEGDVVEGDPEGFAGFFDSPDDDYDYDE